jgi:ribonuclease HI
MQVSHNKHAALAPKIYDLGTCIMAKNKAYVVFEGRKPGVYAHWPDAQEQIAGFPGAVFKGFTTKEEAVLAFEKNLRPKMGFGPKPATAGASAAKPKSAKPSSTDPRPIDPETGRPQGVRSIKAINSKDYIPVSWAVDAACSGNPGQMEYRGVDNTTGEELFHIGPLLGTNNIGEFLALVHALALQQKMGVTIPIYTDSVNAMSWIKAKKARTTLVQAAETKQVWQLIERASTWLQQNSVRTRIIKWPTERWGEIPADFGRK